jgi:acyl-CoA thioesterase-1
VTVATYSLTTSPTMIDDGTSYSVLVTNTGAATVELSRGGRLRPNQAQTVYPEGAALTAAAVTGTSSVSTSTTTKPLPNAADPAALAANAAFTGTYARPVGNRFVPWGDSITLGGDDRTNHLFGTGWPTFAALLSGQRINLVSNAGVSGNTSAQALARFATDVAPYSPAVVNIGIGTNDIGTSVSLATYQANVIAMVAAVRSIGAQPTITTIPPNNTSSHATINKWNHWLRRYANQQRIPLVDFWSLLADPTNGNYLSTYLNDGTHPNNAGYLAMGTLYNTQVAGLLYPWAPYLSGENADTSCLWTSNNLLINDTNADGVPDGWAAFTGSSGFAHALVTDSAVPGKMMQVTMTAAAAVRVLEKNVASGFSAGDVIALSGVVTSDGGVTADFKTSWTGASGSYRTFFVGAVTRGVYYMEATVPAGATQVNVDCIAGAGTGVVAFGRITAVNLTTGAIV